MFLAVDAGGTSSRAVAVDAAGQVLGYGRSGSGNPTSAGIPGAVAGVAGAAQHALAGVEVSADQDVVAVIAMAGEQTPAFFTAVSTGLAALGVQRVILEHDLLAIFCSGTAALDGYALIAGTGSVAARVRGGALERVVGGRGWLLGDAGSGFWIGQRVARAVVSALDGAGPATVLTELVLGAVRIAPPTSEPGDGVRALRQLVSALYARRPVQLAEFAPLAFAAAADPVAAAILDDAVAALADLVATVRTPDLAGPVVVGGSVVAQGFRAAYGDLHAPLGVPTETPITPVPDGVVGAAVLALRHAGIEVDSARHTRLRLSLSALPPL